MAASRSLNYPTAPSALSVHIYRLVWKQLLFLAHTQLFFLEINTSPLCITVYSFLRHGRFGHRGLSAGRFFSRFSCLTLSSQLLTGQ